MYDMGKREKYWVKSVVLQVLQESSGIAWDKWTAWDNGWVVLASSLGFDDDDDGDDDDDDDAAPCKNKNLGRK